MAKKKNKKKSYYKQRSSSRKQERRGGGFGRFLAILLVIILVAAGIGAAYYFTGGFGGIGPTFSVTHAEKTYYREGEDLLLANKAEFEVTRAFWDDYEITIETGDADFDLTVGEEPYKWSQLEGDYTKGFNVTKTDNGFTIEYETLQGILEAVHGAVTIEEDAVGDIFELVIKCAKNEIRIGFGVYLPVSGITLSPDNIIF